MVIATVQDRCSTLCLRICTLYWFDLLHSCTKRRSFPVTSLSECLPCVITTLSIRFCHCFAPSAFCNTFLFPYYLNWFFFFGNNLYFWEWSLRLTVFFLKLASYLDSKQYILFLVSNINDDQFSMFFLLEMICWFCLCSWYVGRSSKGFPSSAKVLLGFSLLQPSFTHNYKCTIQWW